MIKPSYIQTRFVLNRPTTENTVTRYSRVHAKGAALLNAERIYLSNSQFAQQRAKLS